jgi:GNAT superfamily N-acetyltransferase
MQLALLIDHPEAIPLVARWYFDDHGHEIPGNSFEATCARIQGKLNRDIPPVHVLAISDGRPVGVAQWKRYEMPEYPDKEHWLGSVFVTPEHRGKSIGGLLANKVAEIAQSKGVKELYLSTERLDGGFYLRAGWTPYERTISRGDEVLVMIKTLGA